MQLTIKDKTIDLKFGLDFIEFLDSKFNITQNGMRFGLGIQQAYTQLLTRSPLILVDIIRAGQLNSKDKASEKDIKNYIEELEDIEALFTDFLASLEKSSMTKNQVKAIKVELEKAQN